MRSLRASQYLGKLAMACLLALTLGIGSANARGSVSIGIDVPLVVPAPVLVAPPVVVAPPAVYAPAPEYYGPPAVVEPAPPVAQGAASCTQGQWRQQDGSIVPGVACLQPNGTWTLAR